MWSLIRNRRKWRFNFRGTAMVCKMEQMIRRRWKSGIGLKKSVWLSLNVSMIYLEYPWFLFGWELLSWQGACVSWWIKRKGLLVESQGAQVIDLEEYNMPPCLITKVMEVPFIIPGILLQYCTGKSNIIWKCLYVTGLEQSLHFKQIFKAIEVMGYDWADGLVHVPYGLVSLAGEKLSTRGGNIIYAEDILKEAIERAYNAIMERIHH